MSNKVLLAGTTGRLGRKLIPELNKNNYVVSVVARKSERLAPFKNLLSNVHQAEVTKKDTLKGLCDDIDIVISTVGRTYQKDRLSVFDVDYQANVNLLQEARRAGVKKFVYISVLGADSVVNVPVFEAKRKFEIELMTSGLSWVIIRPSGFFTDMLEVFKIAQKGTIYLFGNGNNHLPPISVDDLAGIVCLHLSDSDEVFEVGGPDTFTLNEVAHLCSEILHRKARIRHIPIWVMNVALLAIKIFLRYEYELLTFFKYAMTSDSTAPNVGQTHLRDYFRSELISVKQL